MLRTAGWLALPGRALSAGFDGGISPPFQFVAAQLLGGWDLTEAGLSPASHSRLLWTHNSSALRQEAATGCLTAAQCRQRIPSEGTELSAPNLAPTRSE